MLGDVEQAIDSSQKERKCFPNPTSSTKTLVIPRETKEKKPHTKTLLSIEGTSNFYYLRQEGISNFLNNKETSGVHLVVIHKVH